MTFPIYTFNQYKYPEEEYPSEIKYIAGYYIMLAYGNRNVSLICYVGAEVAFVSK